MGDIRLVHDVSAETARRCVALFDWDREDQAAAAFEAFYRVIRDGIERFRERKARELRRLGKRDPGDT